jgi:translation elongation factor P/translation initiation factor 5A
MKNINWLLTVFFLCFLSQNCRTKDLKTNGKVVNVKIIEMLPAGKAGVPCSYRCEFIYNEKLKNLISSSRVRFNKAFYVGQYFPAMYSEKTGALRILMTSEDFEEFNITYPDSLLNRVFPTSD